MTEKKVYASGSVGPLLYADDELLNDADGDFAGVNYHASVTDGQHWVGAAPTLDEHVVRLVDLVGLAGTKHLFNVADYDEGTDTLNIQAAIDDAEAVNGRVFVPSGTYTITSALTITASIEIFGASRSATIIQTASTTINIFDINAAGPIIIKNLTIQNTGGGGTPTDGAGIYVAAPSTNNGFSRFDNLQINGMYRGIYFVEAALWTVSDCYIVNNILEGINVSNVYSADTGDSTITRCVFDNSDTSGTYAIHQLSSGGLRIINNKILGHQWGYFLDILSGVTTSILLIEGNSIENYATSGIHLTESSGGTFLRIIIDGNQITSAKGEGINIGEGSGELTNFIISDNIITIGANEFGIVLNDGDNFIISGNEIYGANSGDVGIGISSGCANGFVYGNLIYNCATKVGNSSTTTALIQSDGGKVGIGVSPNQILDVIGSLDAGYGLAFSNTHSGGSGAYIAGGNGAGVNIIQGDDYVGNNRFNVFANGAVTADGPFTEFSPVIEKENPTCDDFLDWALEDVEKQHKPYKGLWNAKNPDNNKEAKNHGIKSAEDELDKYGKSPTKIAIGVAEWAKWARDTIKSLEKRIEALEAK